MMRITYASNSRSLDSSLRSSLGMTALWIEKINFPQGRRIGLLHAAQITPSPARADN